MKTLSAQMRLAASFLAVGLAAASCTENAPPKSDLSQGAILPDGIQVTQSTGSVVTVASPGAVISPDGSVPATRTQEGPLATIPMPQSQPERKPAPKEIVIPDKDAKWTIFCTSVDGPAHIEQAKQLKAQLVAATKSSKWYIVHEDDKSSIYYGFYRTIDRGTKEGDLAHADRLRIASMKNAAGEMTLQLATFLQIDRAAPDAPLEWDLGAITRNPKQYWSLQIAAYTADASDAEGHDRKWAAVESVKALRAQGIPAYYYHGESISSVCVGIWPEEAIKKQAGGNAKGNAGSLSAEQTLFVANAPLPPGVTPKDPEGRPMKAMVPKVEIVDSTLLDMMRRFPSHMINAEERMHRVRDPKSGEERMVPAPSFLVEVPEAKASSVTSGQRSSPGITQQVPVLPPGLLQTDQPLPPQPGVGKLREVGH
jgi:hypothetical protein